MREEEAQANFNCVGNFDWKERTVKFAFLSNLTSNIYSFNKHTDSACFKKSIFKTGSTLKCRNFWGFDALTHLCFSVALYMYIYSTIELLLLALLVKN